MFTTYALRSERRSYIYVGLTENLDRRRAEHNRGRNKTTKPYRPFVLIFAKEFDTRAAAREEEKRLKRGIGKEFLRAL
jgi:putative endonuclease